MIRPSLLRDFLMNVGWNFKFLFSFQGSDWAFQARVFACDLIPIPLILHCILHKCQGVGKSFFSGRSIARSLNILNVRHRTVKLAKANGLVKVASIVGILGIHAKFSRIHSGSFQLLHSRKQHRSC